MVLLCLACQEEILAFDSDILVLTQESHVHTWPYFYVSSVFIFMIVKCIVSSFEIKVMF
jgi:hypothetical protein